MTFREAQLTLQLLAEERAGSAQRTEAYVKKARENAAAQAAIAAVSDGPR